MVLLNFVGVILSDFYRHRNQFLSDDQKCRLPCFTHFDSFSLFTLMLQILRLNSSLSLSSRTVLKEMAEPSDLLSHVGSSSVLLSLA